MPRGKKQQASVGFCPDCGQVVQHFYVYNEKENREKVKTLKKYCNICKTRKELRIKKERKDNK